MWPKQEERKWKCSRLFPSGRKHSCKEAGKSLTVLTCKYHQYLSSDARSIKKKKLNSLFKSWNKYFTMKKLKILKIISIWFEKWDKDKINQINFIEIFFLIFLNHFSRLCRSLEELWNLRSSDDRAYDRQSKGPGLDTQRSGSVPVFTENFFRNFLYFYSEKFAYFM